ncbi:MAG: hypothetical protein ACRD3K_05320 [Edaphobacter sp.]
MKLPRSKIENLDKSGKQQKGRLTTTHENEKPTDPGTPSESLIEWHFVYK